MEKEKTNESLYKICFYFLVKNSNKINYYQLLSVILHNWKSSATRIQESVSLEET